jgi:hypothetical protein
MFYDETAVQKEMFFVCVGCVMACLCVVHCQTVHCLSMYLTGTSLRVNLGVWHLEIRVNENYVFLCEVILKREFIFIFFFV